MPAFVKRIALILFIPFIVVVCFRCGAITEKKISVTRAMLEGSWKEDSIYSYDNGFGFTRRDMEEEPLQHYQPDGRLRMTKEAEFRFFYYDIPAPDSLIHRTLDNKILGRFKIESLDNGHFVLRKEKKPLFTGKNQVRYELRYFSRIKE